MLDLTLKVAFPVATVAAVFYMLSPVLSYIESALAVLPTLN